jgi:cation diffusion facilitator family transporter
MADAARAPRAAAMLTVPYLNSREPPPALPGPAADGAASPSSLATALRARRVRAACAPHPFPSRPRLASFEHACALARAVAVPRPDPANESLGARTVTAANGSTHSPARHGTASDAAHRLALGIRSAQAGLVVNAALVLVKLIAGIVGHAYVLIADAVESSTDIFAGLIVWRGLAIAAQPADEDHPFGHGKAEQLAAAAVALMLLGAAVGITIAAIGEIRTPHHVPAPFTLGVAAAVIVIKGALSRRVAKVGNELGSTAVRADAWHHAADAISSAAAFVGIAVALLGSRIHGGPGWAAADDWAALVAAAMIATNGFLMLRPAVHALMDRSPSAELNRQIASAALAVPGVRAIEHLRVRASGLEYLVDVHVQADPDLSLHDAHVLSGCVKGAIRAAVPDVAGVLIHMEPYEPSAG